MKKHRRREKRTPHNFVDLMLARKLAEDRLSFARERRIRRTMWGAARERALKKEHNIRRVAFVDFENTFTAWRMMYDVRDSRSPGGRLRTTVSMVRDYTHLMYVFKKFAAEDHIRVHRACIRHLDFLSQVIKRAAKYRRRAL
ncbi:MAG: hypothetical protein ACYYKD_10410 [Rhodospirillales bacterium]